MRRAPIFVLVLALVAPVAAQEPASVPTWQQCTENLYLTPQYPGWKPDAETELTDDDFDNCADDDCYRSLLERAINELIHQRAEIANLKRQLTEIQSHHYLEAVPCQPGDCVTIPGTWPPLLPYSATPNVVISPVKKVP